MKNPPTENAGRMSCRIVFRLSGFPQSAEFEEAHLVGRGIAGNRCGIRGFQFLHGILQRCWTP